MLPYTIMIPYTISCSISALLVLRMIYMNYTVEKSHASILLPNRFTYRYYCSGICTCFQK